MEEFIYIGALFVGLVVVMFNGIAELTMTVAKLHVFYKQRDLQFFPAWAYSLLSWILKIPMSFIEVGVWTFLTYHVIGFDPNIGRFFKQYVLLLFVNQMTNALFRFLAAVGRNMIVANTFGAFTLVTLFALGGVVLSRENIKKWWIWGYWISPLKYGQNAIVVNEFLGKKWSHIPAGSTKSLGIKVLKSRGFFTEAYWYWIGLVVMIGFMFLFNFFYALALTYLSRKYH